MMDEVIAQSDFDTFYAQLANGSSASSPRYPLTTESWLEYLDGLTSDAPSDRCLVPEDDAISVQEVLAELDVVVLPTATSLPNYAVPQQLLPFIAKYTFEMCRSTYFESAERPVKKESHPSSKSQNGLSCDFPPDYKCKTSAFHVITICPTMPSCSLCARCGSLGDHTMVHCLGCCEVFHYFCAHLPERLVLRLTTWFCHRCAVCSICTGRESAGKKFVSDIIETCFRCQSQFHVHCQRTNNFNLLNQGTSKQMMICNRCLFRSNCNRCRCPITPEDVYRESCELSPHVCVECRNMQERDLCRKCFLDLRMRLNKFICEQCRDVYHSDCLCDADRFRLATGLSFICSGCLPRVSAVYAMKKIPERWSWMTGQRILKRFRAEIIHHMNGSLDKRFEKSHKLTTNQLSSFKKLLDRNPRNDITSMMTDCHFAPAEAQKLCFDEDVMNMGAVNLRQDNGFHPEIIDKIVAATTKEELTQGNQPSPDSGTGTESCDIEDEGSPDSSFNSTQVHFQQYDIRTLPWYYNQSSISSPTIPIFTSAILSSPDKHLQETPIFLIDQMITTVQADSLMGRKSCSPRTDWHSIMLRCVDEMSFDNAACADPNKLAQKMYSLMTEAGFSLALQQKMAARFTELCSEVPILMRSAAEPGGETNQSILAFPVLRRGSEQPPTVKLKANKVADKRVQVFDLRLCFFCSMAGDDNSHHAGRLLPCGQDLWVHIGCLSFAAMKKRVFDYFILKLANLDSSSASLRRRECALCPLPLGLLGCAQKRCRNSYHMNCALLENSIVSTCLLSGSIGMVCPEHKLDDLAQEHNVKGMLLGDLQRSFLEMPVFARASPTNVQNLGNSSWMSGVRKENVKVYVGAAFVEELGRLARGWNTKEILLPCGYKMHRIFWSTLAPNRLTKYTFLTLDLNSHPAIKALICTILEMEDIPDIEYLREKKTNRLAKAQQLSASDSTIDQEWQCEKSEIVLDEVKIRHSLKTNGSLNGSLDSSPSPAQSKALLIHPICPVPLENKTVHIEQVKRQDDSRSSSPEIPLRQPVHLPREPPPAKRPHSPLRASGISGKILGPANSDGTLVLVNLKRLKPNDHSSPINLHYVNPSTASEASLTPTGSTSRRSIRSSKDSSASPEIEQPRKPSRSLTPIDTKCHRSTGGEDIDPCESWNKKLPDVESKRTLGKPLHTAKEINHRPIRSASGHRVLTKKGIILKFIKGKIETPIKVNAKKDLVIIPKKMVPASDFVSLGPTIVQLEKNSPEFFTRKSARLIELQTQNSGDSSHFNGLRSCLKGCGGEERRRVIKGVKFSPRLKVEHTFVPSFNVLPVYIADPAMEFPPGPYFPPRDDCKLNPGLFSAAKHRGRMEVAETRKRRIDELLGMIKTSDLSRLSKHSSQICILTGEDGFFAASHWPEELVTHLFAEIECKKRLNGITTPRPFRMDAGEFVGLTIPVVRYLLEQLPIPANSTSIYQRNFFTKEALKTRPKLDLKSSDVLFSLRQELTCWTCPLPGHYFTVINGRTFTLAPVMERQVVLKWSAPYHVVSDLKDALPKWIRIFNSSFVDPVGFPDWYNNIRHDRKQTFVLTYALHLQDNIVFLALVSKQNFPAGTEVRFDPKRDPHRVRDVMGVENFSCATHGRNY